MIFLKAKTNIQLLFLKYILNLNYNIMNHLELIL